MHRAPFWVHLFLLIYSGALLAQNPGLELFWSYQEKEDQSIRAYIEGLSSGETCYLLRDATILSVQRSEGRLKEKLPFSYDKQKLCIQIPQNWTANSRLFIQYQLPWSQLDNSPFINLLEPGMVLNALNIEEAPGSGQNGIFFPAPASGVAQWIRLNLHLPKGLHLESPLENEYLVKEAQRISYFLKSEQPVLMPNFYLAIGDFKKFDVDDFPLDLSAQLEQLETERINTFEQEFQSVLRYLSEKQDRIFLREDLIALADLKPSNQVPNFPRFEEIPLAANYQKRVLALFENAFKEESEREWAAYWHQELSPEKWNFLLENHRKEGDQNPLYWEYRLAAHLAKANLHWQDSSRAISHQDSLLIQNAKYFLNRRRPIEVMVKYRLYMPEKRFYFYTEHGDTNLTLAASLQGMLYFKDDSLAFRADGTLAAEDTLFTGIEEAPRSIYLNDDSDGLILWQDQRPLTYLLFDLAHAPKAHQRKAALLELLEKAPSKLLTTSVGIALDSEDPEIQLLGLSKVKDLSPDGRARLKESIIALAADASNVKVKQKAAELLQNLEFWTICNW